MIKNGFASVTPPPISPTLPTLTAKTPEAMQKSPLYIKTETPRMVDDHSITRTPVKHQNGEITAKHPLNVNEVRQYTKSSGYNIYFFVYFYSIFKYLFI